MDSHDLLLLSRLRFAADSFAFGKNNLEGVPPEHLRANVQVAYFALALLFVEGSFEHGKQEGAIGLFAPQFGDDVAQCELGNGFCGDVIRKIVPDRRVVFEDDNHALANMVELFFFAESRDGLLCRGQ